MLRVASLEPYHSSGTLCDLAVFTPDALPGATQPGMGE